MRPTITIEKTEAPEIRMNEGARNAIVPARRNLYLDKPRSNAVSTVGAGAFGLMAGAASGMVSALFGGNRTTDNSDHRQWHDNRSIDQSDHSQDNSQDNRQWVDNSQRTQIDSSTSVEYDIDNSQHTQNSTTNYNEVTAYSTTEVLHNQSSSNSFIDSRDQSVTNNVSNQWLDQSQHTTNVQITDDHSVTNNINNTNINASFSSANQAMVLGIFFGDGLEKIAMAMIIVGGMIAFVLTQFLLLAAAVSGFVMTFLLARAAFKRYQFKKEFERKERNDAIAREEAALERAHRLELAKISQPVTININVASTEQVADVVEVVTQGRIGKVKEVMASDLSRAKEAYGAAGKGIQNLANDTVNRSIDAAVDTVAQAGAAIKAAPGKAKDKVKTAATNTKEAARREVNLFVEAQSREAYRAFWGEERYAKKYKQANNGGKR